MPMSSITIPKVMLVMTSGETALWVVCPEVAVDGEAADDIVESNVEELNGRDMRVKKQVLG